MPAFLLDWQLVVCMLPFDFQPRTRLIFGVGSFERLGAVAAELSFRRTLLVADPGIVGCGYADQARKVLSEAGITAFVFHDFNSNPDSVMVEAGRSFAADRNIDSIVGLGGGSSMDCAKGVNFLLTNGGAVQDYWGYAKTRAAMLPMIGIPTTAGTGSEAQSYALISDAKTHAKMACGDPQAAFRVAILDPRLTVSQPPRVTATTGIDAIGHAVETYVTKSRNSLSELLSREAWRLLEPNYERVLLNPDDIEARGAMQLGSYWAGLAIENSMLGAAHACANPLTARYGTDHGIAVGLMLPHVVRWNGETAGEQYREILMQCSANEASQAANCEPAERLAFRLRQLLGAGGLPSRLRDEGVPEAQLKQLAEEAATQWTGRFNPREFGIDEALELYRSAY
jgi:alcohol dehydrogenase